MKKCRIFFLPKSNPSMPLVNFREKKFASFPSILARFSKCEHFRGDWAYAEPNFFGETSKKFFFLKVHFGPIRWVPKRFFVVEICILIRDSWVIFENYSMRISSLAEHARKCLKVECLGWIEYDFQKSRVIGPWDHKVLVSAKKF